MRKELLSLGLSGLLILVIAAAPASAQTQAGTNPQLADKVKTKVTRLGTGKQARVEVRLLDNTKLKGYIGEIGEDRFTVIDPKRGVVTPVQYAQVQKIKDTNHMVMIGIVFAAVSVGVIVLFSALHVGG